MQELFAVQYAWLIPLLPLIGAAIAGFWGEKHLRQHAHWPIWIGVGISALISLSLLTGMLMLPQEQGEAHSSLSTTVHLYDWISAGDPHNEGTEKNPQRVFGNDAASFHVNAGFFLDPINAVMLCVICGIGFLITVFAKGYMAGEVGYYRFFAYLGLFIFAMTILVMGDNLIMLYLGWEGVGLCSYLLIGYYYEKPSAREAAKKAFLVNRVGDFGFSIGIMLAFLAFGTVSYFGNGVGTHTGLLELVLDRGAMDDFQQLAIKWIPFLLMIGAFGKSAQFPLYVWLPDAMEGPTPVSALIHAATMVTAGIYMIARCGTLFVTSAPAMWTIAIVGCFTALFAATIALRQFDLKKVFAYSTISQLGFMFVAVGVFAPVAGMFHLVTHAFFKALLFLSSGVVMHAMSGELDMRKMSGLYRVLPKTNILILIGCAALAGFPLTSGFFSKDEIVAAAFAKHWLLGAVLLFTAFLTAYYTFRLYFQVFLGPLVVPEAPAGAHGHGHEPHEHAAASSSAIQTGTAPASGVDEGQVGHAPAASTHAADGDHTHTHDDHAHAHDHEPAVMWVPLAILALGAALGGLFNLNDGLADFLGRSPSFKLAYELSGASAAAFGQPEAGAPQPAAHGLMILSGVISLAGIALAFLLHLQARAAAERIASGLQPLTGLIEHKYWVDELYQALIVEPLRSLGRFLFAVDRFLVDGLVNVVGFVPQLCGFILRVFFQRGYLQGYAAAMLLGIAAILVFVFMT